jgi:hypothetical protein
MKSIRKGIGKRSQDSDIVLAEAEGRNWVHIGNIQNKNLRLQSVSSVVIIVFCWWNFALESFSCRNNVIFIFFSIMLGEALGVYCKSLTSFGPIREKTAL